MGASSIHSPRYRSFAGKLKAWREDAGLSQRALGERLKKPHTYVAKSETAERKLDILELFDWLKACEIEPMKAIRQLLNEHEK